MYLVFDIGGSKIRIAGSIDGKTLTDVKTFETPQKFADGINLIKDTGLSLAKGKLIKAIAGGIAGPLDPDKTMLVNTPNIAPDWIGKPLKKDLEGAFSSPAYLGNDTVMVGLGEIYFGAARDKNFNIVAYITVSTGLGGCRFVKGKVDESSLGFEPGHQIIAINGQECGCKGLGHLESYVSGRALEGKYGKEAKDITDPVVWSEMAKILAVGLNNVSVLWSPDVIILGGGLMHQISIDEVKEHLDKTLTIFPNKPKLLKAALDDHGGLYGSVAYLTQIAQV